MPARVRRTRFLGIYATVVGVVNCLVVFYFLDSSRNGPSVFEECLMKPVAAVFGLVFVFFFNPFHSPLPPTAAFLGTSILYYALLFSPIARLRSPFVEEANLRSNVLLLALQFIFLICHVGAIFIHTEMVRNMHGGPLG